LAHVRGERPAQTLDCVRRRGGIQPLQDLVGAREAAGPVEGGGDVRTLVDRFAYVGKVNVGELCSLQDFLQGRTRHR
jgi:hypothetical protein